MRQTSGAQNFVNKYKMLQYRMKQNWELTVLTHLKIIYSKII